MKRQRPEFLFLFILWMVASLPAMAQSPLHHYIFEGETTDIAGGADAVLLNGATLTDHTVVLDGIDDFIDLPIDATVSGLVDFTVLGWWTCTSCPRWARLFDFGEDTDNYMTLATSSFPTNAMYYAIEVGNGRQDITGPRGFPTGKELCVAVSFDSTTTTTTVRVYDDVLIEFSSTNTTHIPSDLGATRNWIGRSQFSADPYFGGSINEFRLYGEALDSDTIGNICGAGPLDGLLFKDSFEDQPESERLLDSMILAFDRRY